ncbi:MAG: NFACT family protein, partial [Blastocatellia bacterium]|nr:NFACT family protein [Blastocatellia bacterium]
MSIDDFLLERIVNESIPEVVGQSVGKIFEPSPLEFAISLKRSDGISLFFSLLPARPGFFLTDRSHKFLETDRSAGYFVNLLRKHLSTSKIVSIEKEPLERRFQVLFSGFDSAGEALKLSLLVELTGRSANAHLFVADAHLASLRETADREQSLIFSPKTRYIPSQQEFESKVENEGVLAATRYYL